MAQRLGLYTPSGLTAEYDEAGNLLREYQFKPNQPWMTDLPLQRTATGAVYYYQNDHLGTPQRLLSDTGAVVLEASYRAFGEATVVKALVSNPLRFSGQYFDERQIFTITGIGLMIRSLGRYLQRDPIGLLGGINTYGYAYQNPLSYIDPDSLLAHLPFATAVGATARCCV